jgi:hypothetical protein
MRQYIEYIKANYQHIRENQTTELYRSYRTEMFQNISRIFQSDLVQKFDDIEVLYSEGIGKLPLVPWLVFLNKEVASSPRRGFYVVYLFSEDLKRLYLSLNQGWTQYKKDSSYRKLSQKVSAAENKAIFYRNLLDLSDDYSQTISLGDGDYAKGYEACNIFAIEYDLDNIPDQDTLNIDLEIFLEHYLTLASLLQNDNDETSSEPSMTQGKSESNESTIRYKKAIASDLEEFTRTRRSTNGRSSVDFDAIYKTNKKHGEIGERIVLEYERNKAKNNGFDPDLVKLVSNDIKLGYDIVSLNDQGDEIFIEVKATNKKGNQSFIISINEIEKFEHFSDKYFIYRVSHLFTKTPEILEIDYVFFQSMYKKASQFTVYFKREKLG